MVYEQGYGEKAPCDTCTETDIPDLAAENEVVLDVFLRVRDQHIMGEGGPVAINIEPIFKVMDIVGVESRDKLDCLDLVMAAYRAALVKYRKGKGSD